MNLRRRVGALCSGVAAVVVGCGGGGGIAGLTDLPDGVFTGVVAPAAEGTVAAGPGMPLAIALQVDPRTIDSNCSLKITVVVSDESGTLSRRRVAVLAPPIRTELVEISLAFTVDDPAARPTDGEEPAEVPVDLPDAGDYLGLVTAALVAPEADDPASKLSQYDLCRDRLGLLPGATAGLEASRSFTLRIEGGDSGVTTVATTVADTQPSTSGSEPATSDTSGGGGGGGGTRTTTTTVKSATTTTTTVKATTTTDSTTTTTIPMPTTSTTVAQPNPVP